MSFAFVYNAISEIKHLSFPERICKQKKEFVFTPQKINKKTPDGIMIVNINN